MTTKIIAAFPGTGKSYFASTVSPAMRVIDLVSSAYTSGYTNDGHVRNTDFPNNYLRAIKENLGQAALLFISCQPEVLAALRRGGIAFSIVYPQRGLKTEYVRRFSNRDSPPSFIELISRKWDIFLDFLENQTDCQRIVLGSDQYIADVYRNIK